MEQQRKLAAGFRRWPRGERWLRFRWWSLRVLAALLGVALCAAGSEEVLEQRARARLTAGATFVDVDGASIRYQLAGKSHGRPTVVFLTGIGGSIEQMVDVERRLASSTQTLVYDRGGYGFSAGSGAYDAAEQAVELEHVLKALKIEGKVVLVAFSSSSSIARLFAARYPERTQGIYMVEPYLPEIDRRVPGRKSPRRAFMRWIAHDLSMSTFGLLRAKNTLASFAGPTDPVEQRAQEILQSRHHFWALAREWYTLPATAEQTIAAPVGTEPIVIMFTEHLEGGAEAHVREQLFEEFVKRTPRGKLVRMGKYDHSKLLSPGPALDLIEQGVLEIVSAS